MTDDQKKFLKRELILILSQATEHSEDNCVGDQYGLCDCQVDGAELIAAVTQEIIELT